MSIETKVDLMLAELTSLREENAKLRSEAPKTGFHVQLTESKSGKPTVWLKGLEGGGAIWMRPTQAAMLVKEIDTLRRALIGDEETF